jgi:pilus assembly protein CpaB
MALSVSFAGAASVNGFVVPGSDVAVFLTSKDGTQLLLPRVSVIGVGPRTLVPASGQNTSQTASGIVTFAVTEGQAQKLIYAQTAGTLYLSLLTKDSLTPTLPATSASNVFAP